VGRQLPSRAQGTANRLRRIGALVGTSPYPKLYTAFEQELQDRGWRIGENILIEYRFAEGHLERLPALAAELVDHKVELIFAVTAPETRAAKAATRTIPIVFAAHGDPVESGDVLSFAHPGCNATGLSQMHPELGRKQLEFLKE
jgi:putative tryptophan/tyrosine transport system substrate-binding protein